MATKNIKKILLNKDGDNFVADIENIENRISQNSSDLKTSKQELSDKCNTVLNDAKAYTETKLADYVTKTENTNTLEQAKQYANSKADNALSQAKTDASQKYLPLTGGFLSGNLWSTRSTQYEQQMGLNDPSSGAIYMFSNSQKRGIYTINLDKLNSAVLTINNSGRVDVYAGVIHLNGADITVG